MKNIMKYFFLFLIFYQYQLPILRNSTALVVIFLIGYCLINQKALSNLMFFMKDKCVTYVFLMILFLTCIAVIVPILYKTYDFTMLNNAYAGLIVGYIACISWLAVFFKKSDNIFLILRTIVIANVIQSIIMIFAFLIPEIKEFVQLFQSDNTMAIADGYGGIRGLALARSSFFGLATLFGVVVCINKYLYVYDKQNRSQYIIYFIILFIGSMFVGRTAIVGCILSLFFLMFLLFKEKDLKGIGYFLGGILICSFVIFSICIIVLSNNNIEMITTRLLPFAFEFIYNYIDYGTVSTSSTDYLQQKMYYALDEETLLFGDGRWMVVEGGNNYYYRETDAGYMRTILFTGIWGTTLLFYYFFYIIYIIYKSDILKMNSLAIILAIWALIVQYKGDAIGYLFQFMSIYFFIFLFLRYKKMNNF